MADWTPVSEEMPPEGEAVLCCSPTWPCYAMLYLEDGVWEGPDASRLDCGPSHWMPLPEPPEPPEEPNDD